MTTSVGPILESLVNQEHFNESEFVERLTKKLVFLQQVEFKGGSKKTNLSNVEFNPESFLKTFTSALDGLHKLAEKLDKKIEGLETETTEAERTHKVKLALFQDNFEQNFKHFSELDSRISKVGSAAVTIGERLETDDTQRERALQVKELIEYYLHLNTMSNEETKEKKDDSGHISDLSDVDDDEVPDSPKPSHLNRLQEGNTYAKTLLKNFLEFNTHRDKYKIKKYNYKYTQTVLSHNMESISDNNNNNSSEVFQEGVGLGQNNPTNPMNIVYVFENQKTQQFYEKCIIAKKLLSISQELDIDRLQKAKDNIFAICSELEKQILGEFKAAYKAYDVKKMKECSIILYEFNGGDSCVGHYIERYIHPSPQLLQDDIDIARRVSDIAVALETGTPVDDTRISEFFEEIVKTCEDEFKTINRVFPNPTKVMAMLVQQLAKNRIKHFVNEILEHDTQIKLWLFMRTLSGCYTAAVKFTESCHPYKIFTIISVEALLDEIFLDYKDNYVTKEIQSLTSIFLEELSKNNQLRQQQSDNKDAGTLISLEMALNFMHASEEAVKRCVLLSHKMELPQNLTKIFNSLLNYLCKKYVNVALSKAVQVLPVACIGSYQRTVGMIENFFEMIYFVNQIVIFIQKHFHVDILPHISSSANDLTNCSNKKNTALSKLEDKIHEGISKSLSAIMSSIDIILRTQKKNDYYLSDSASTPYSNAITQTCSEVISFVKRIKIMFEKNLDGKNVDSLLEEFGKKLYASLLAHYKKFYVSPGLGGLLLLQDLTAYRDCAKLFNSENVVDKFELLKEIAAIYHVAPDNLKILFTDTKLSKLDKNDVLQFIKLRTDFKAAWVGKYI